MRILHLNLGRSFVAPPASSNNCASVAPALLSQFKGLVRSLVKAVQRRPSNFFSDERVRVELQSALNVLQPVASICPMSDVTDWAQRQIKWAIDDRRYREQNPPSGTSQGTSTQSCGRKLCQPGYVCCNPFCEICTPPGGTCNQTKCTPPNPSAGLPYPIDGTVSDGPEWSMSGLGAVSAPSLSDWLPTVLLIGAGLFLLKRFF